MSEEGDDTEAEKIGERISARMDELKIEAPVLAKTLGVHQDTIYKLMRGETAARWVNLIRLSHALQTTPNELLGFDVDTRPRLIRLLIGAFEGLGATVPQARNYAELWLEVLDRPPNPQPRVPESEELRIEIASAKRRSERL